ncbi:MAG: helix-turn-helix domain-containing protein [Planctomycetota bacterium]|nr:helix-turn-helix domain-containing protein [Planctomycetota bacterium]
MNDPHPWTAREAAEHLRVTPGTVNDLRRRGLLRAWGRTSPNGRWLYDPEEVRSYARRCASLPSVLLVDDVAAMIDAAVAKERGA